MSALAVEQPDLWDEVEPVIAGHEDGIGRVLSTHGGAFRARYTGSRYGWQFDRAITWVEYHRVWIGRWRSVLAPLEVEGWEAWEPELGYGVEHVLDRATAVTTLLALVARHGDDPRWLDRVNRTDRLRVLADPPT